MQIDEFTMAVRQMRYYQKQYFSTRDSRALESSKKSEAKVDDMLEQLFEPKMQFT